MESTDRGRTFPIKSWDDPYFDILAASEFVLCPNGDDVWTYRFFESCLCGAIPVVEQTCALYEGFHLYTMNDQPTNMVWTEELAAENQRKAEELLTVPTADLTRAIGL
jgi:hypothetical protein